MRIDLDDDDSSEAESSLSLSLLASDMTSECVSSISSSGGDEPNMSARGGSDGAGVEA